MGSAATVPMLAPDGTPGDIPQERVQDAVKAGFKQAVSMTSPDGKTGYIPLERQQDALSAGFKLSAASQPTAPTEGFFHSLGAQFGLTPEAAKAALQDQKDHPIKSFLLNLVDPTGVARGIYSQAKQSAGELGQAYQGAKEGNPAAVAQHTITAVPVVGPALAKGADQYAQGNYAGEAGTLLGASAQAAPAVLGAADAAGVPRPNTSLPNVMSKFPTKSGAGEIFNKLNTALAQQPVVIDNAAAPLQRAIEIGARGGTLPGPVDALLKRSQAVEPMTFPEARDYQASLSDLSASDKLAMNGRMRGAVAQLNQALYQDIRQAAEAGGGYGSDFDTAMTKYRQASQISNAAKAAVKYGVRGAAGAAGAAGVYKLGQEIASK